MFIQRMLHSKLLRIVALVSILLGTLLPFSGQSVNAQEESVYISDNVYFTLNDVALASGADSQMLRFGLELVNGSEQSVDFNQYGVRVVDNDGYSYAVDLSERAVARVQPNQSNIFRYMATIPPGISADALHVVVFAWDFNQSSFMSDIGTLSVGAAVQPGTTQRQAVVLNMSDVDSTYPTDAFVSFELIRSYKALSGGTWYLYSDLAAENLSGSSLKLPSGLQFMLRDGDQLTYAATAAYGGDQTILPHQRNQITMQAAIGTAVNGGGFTMEFFKKAATTGTTGTTGNNANTSTAQSSAAAASTTLLGRLDLSRSVQLNVVGESASYASKDKNTLTFVVDKVTSALKSDGIHVDASFTVTNNSPATLAVPTLNATLQLTQSTLSVAAADNSDSTHPVYLASGGSENYKFLGLLPKGVDPAAVQLIVFEKKTGTPAVSVPVNVTQLPAAVDTSGAGNSGGVSTSIGTLALSLKSTYRLMTESGDDVLMSEISVQNVDSNIVALPAAASLYGGHMIGDFDAQGKAIRIQTSGYLSPGQKTTIYVYSKVPYSTVINEGYAYIGDQNFNAQTQAPADKNEWIELPFSQVGDGLTPTALNTEWFIADNGRQSTGKIIESKLYDNSTGQKTIAVRVLQTNKETRNGANVPYIGYITDGNGSVWSLKATEEAGKLCKECQALTTLWANVPANVATGGGLQVVFGQKIDTDAFASAQQYAFDVSPEPGNVTSSSISNASLYPYTVSVQNAKWRTTVSGGSTGIEVNFDYNQSKTADMTGGSKNRNLQFALVDASGNVMKVQDIPLEGTLTIGNTTVPVLTSGSTAKVTFPGLTFDQLNAFLFSPRLAVYEKFEGSLRLIGTLSLTNG